MSCFVGRCSALTTNPVLCHHLFSQHVRNHMIVSWHGSVAQQAKGCQHSCTRVRLVEFAASSVTQIAISSGTCMLSVIGSTLGNDSSAFCNCLGSISHYWLQALFDLPCLVLSRTASYDVGYPNALRLSLSPKPEQLSFDLPENRSAGNSKDCAILPRSATQSCLEKWPTKERSSSNPAKCTHLQLTAMVSWTSQAGSTATRNRSYLLGIEHTHY